MENAASSNAPDPSAEPPPSASQKARKWLKFVLRWGIAVVGLFWVINQMSFWDKILVVDANGIPQPMTLADPAANENQAEYRVVGREKPVPRSETVNRPDRKTVRIDGERSEVPLLGLDLYGNLDRNPRIQRLLVKRNGKGSGSLPIRLPAGHTSSRCRIRAWMSASRSLCAMPAKRTFRCCCWRSSSSR